jgi:hypothetical protein
MLSEHNWIMFGQPAAQHHPHHKRWDGEDKGQRGKESTEVLTHQEVNFHPYPQDCLKIPPSAMASHNFPDHNVKV